MNDRRRNRKNKQKREKQAFKEAMYQELREHRSSFIVFYLLRILVIVALVRQAMHHNYEGMFFCVLTILLFYIPSWLQVQLRIELPPPLEITILRCGTFHKYEESTGKKLRHINPSAHDTRELVKAQEYLGGNAGRRYPVL